MVGWQRNLSSIVCQFVSRAEQQIHARTGLLTPLAKCYSTQAEIPHVKHKLGAASEPTYQQFRCYARYLGISSSRPLHANASDDGSMQPVPSPLTPLPGPSGGSADSKAVVHKPDKVQAVLKNIKQSPKKLNLVAALVRGMTVEDALIQLQVTVKRAAKTVYQVIHSARANATHNHGLDADRLLVAEAHVGKGRFLKRVNYHGRGKCGVRVKPESRLTVVVRELTPEEEAKIARLKVSKFRKFSKRERQLIPHKLIETTPRWHHKRRARDQVPTTPA